MEVDIVSKSFLTRDKFSLMFLNLVLRCKVGSLSTSALALVGSAREDDTLGISTRTESNNASIAFFILPPSFDKLNPRN